MLDQVADPLVGVAPVLLEVHLEILDLLAVAVKIELKFLLIELELLLLRDEQGDLFLKTVLLGD